jgi:hypothetical protein
LNDLQHEEVGTLFEYPDSRLGTGIE